MNIRWMLAMAAAALVSMQGCVVEDQPTKEPETTELGSISGLVLGRDGVPLAGAKVYLIHPEYVAGDSVQPNPYVVDTVGVAAKVACLAPPAYYLDSAVTNSAGIFGFSSLVSESYGLEISSALYRTYTGIAKIIDGKSNVQQIILQPMEDTTTYCPYIYEPVCGTDGNTYLSSCAASVSGVSVAYAGACVEEVSCALVDCAAGYTCEMQSNNCGTGVSADSMIYLNCVPDTVPVCVAVGTVKTDTTIVYVSDDPLPSVCTTEYSPVCGSNGVTYGNACAARASGLISYYVQGACVGSSCTMSSDCSMGSGCVLPASDNGIVVDTVLVGVCTKN